MDRLSRLPRDSCPPDAMRLYRETMAAGIREWKRTPTAVMHDRAPQFAGQVERQLRVLEVEQCRLPPRLPALNGILERTLKSLRWELLDHIRVSTVEQLQRYLRRVSRVLAEHQVPPRNRRPDPRGSS